MKGKISFRKLTKEQIKQLKLKQTKQNKTTKVQKSFSED